MPSQHHTNSNLIKRSTPPLHPGNSLPSTSLSWHHSEQVSLSIPCPQTSPLNKLCELNLPTHLFNWITDYLSNRFQKVVYSGVTSHALPVTSGVPQGSIFGPLLFLLYINDLPSSFSDRTNIMVYADDILLYKPVRSDLDPRRSFQCDVNLLSNWISDNHLTMNTSKTKSMTISRARIIIPLQMGFWLKRYNILST